MATTKIPFRTQFTEHERFFTATGNGMKELYGYEIDPKGKRTLVKTGEESLYNEIQLYAEDCKIDNILQRVAVGDYKDFRPNGIFADVTEVPNNLIDAQKAMMKVENMWNVLKPEIKAKYDNSLEMFIAQAGKESWLVDTGMIQPITPEETPSIKEAMNEGPKTETAAEA